MKLKYILLLTIAGLLFYSCEPEIDAYEYTSGSADFSRYVALGNSLTAGYADGALYKEGQQNSWPMMLSNEFKKFGGGDFPQPLMPNDDGVGVSATPQGYYFRTKTILGFNTDCLGTTSMSPVPSNPNATQEQLQADLMTPVAGPFNNFGIPAAKSFHFIAPGYGDMNGIPLGTANPFFVRMTDQTIAANATAIGIAAERDPTFYTVWVGANDALLYGISGGMGDVLTPQETFGFAMNTILEVMSSKGAKGAIGNIPEITSIPFFTTVPPNGYVVTQGQADTLNMFLGSLGFEYQAGPNYFIVEDTTAVPLGFRQMKEGEFLLLTVPQDSLKCAFWGGFNPYTQLPVPIPGQYVLDATEKSALNAAVSGYNATIRTLADQYGLAHVDMNAYLQTAESGLVYNGETFTSSFITGNAFSTDGVHLTPKGYVLVANQFIEAINQKFGSNVPLVSTTAYRANILP